MPRARTLLTGLLLGIALVVAGLRWRRGHDLPPDPAIEPSVGVAVAAEDLGSNDPDEQEAFRNEVQAVTDGATSVHATEMPAYYRLLRWAEEDSHDEIRSQAARPTFHDLLHAPNAHRGKAISLDLNIRRALKYDLPPDNPLGVKQVYELWGWPSDARGWLYVVVTPELPANFPLGEQIEAEATVSGYFLKLQGYQPANAKVGAPPLAAPFLIGRILWRRPSAPNRGGEGWFLAIVVLAAMMFAARPLSFALGRRSGARSIQRRRDARTEDCAWDEEPTDDPDEPNLDWLNDAASDSGKESRA